MNPSSIELARQRWLTEDFDAALDFFRQAMRENKDDLRLAVETATYLALRFEIEEALLILQRCEAALSLSPDGLVQVGLAYERAYRPQDAERCFRRVQSLDPQHVRNGIALARWFERRGEWKDAIELLSNITSEEKSDELALRQAVCLRQLGDVESSMEILRGLLDRRHTAPQIRIASAYELGAIHDRRQEGAFAFQYVGFAKQLQRPGLTEQLRRTRQLMAIEANFVQTAQRDQMESWTQASESTGLHPPLMLLTGPPRSGTTLIARMLGNHSQVVLADELPVYPTYIQSRMLRGARGTNAAEILAQLEPATLHHCREAYFRSMLSALGEPDTRGDQKLLLDKNPSLTFLIPPFRRLFPHAIILMAVRDPLDVIVSCYLQNLPPNPISACFNTLAATVSRCCAEWTAWLRLREILPRPWCELRYEPIVQGDYTSLVQTLGIMGLRFEGSLAEFHEELRVRPTNSPSCAQLFEPIDGRRIGRWRQYQTELEPFFPTIMPIRTALGYTNR